MSVSQNFPDEGPSLVLNFAGAEKLDPRITFTRSSTGTYLDRNGLVVTAPANSPRFDHSYNGSNVESLGLLIEESRSNLTTYSEDYSNNSFTSDILISTNTITSPDGATTADTLTANINGGSNTCNVDKNFSISSNTDYTYSVFLKAGTSSKSTTNIYFTGGTFRQAVLEITWGATPSTVLTTTGGTTATSSLVSYPNGWYRAIITYNSGNNTAGGVSRVYVRDQGTSNVSGQTVYAWGHQVETGAFPTSYIPTVASTVTRSADNASMTGTNFSSFYRQDEGTFVVNFAMPNATDSRSHLTAGDGTANERIIITNNSSLTGTSFRVVDGGADQCNIDRTQSFTNGATVKVASAYKVNDYAISQNGDAVGIDTSGTLPTVTTLFIGTNGVSQYSNSYTRYLTYYPKRLTNSQLQNLTK